VLVIIPSSSLWWRPQWPTRRGIKTSHRSTKEDDRLPTIIALLLFISLLLVFSFFESWDEILFKGVGLSHPKISNFRMWIEWIFK
jgi:hypothetical protein